MMVVVVEDGGGAAVVVVEGCPVDLGVRDVGTRDVDVALLGAGTVALVSGGGAPEPNPA